MDVIAPEISSSLYNYMLRSHLHLETEYVRLLEAMKLDTPEIESRYCELEHELLAHMEAEERYVLPAFGRVDRDEALALLREHGALREYLLELGIAIDLHLASYSRSEEFVAVLRAHASRENELLYRWAAKGLDPKLARQAVAHSASKR